MMLEYYRVRGDVIPPSRANPSDAGLDVHFNPEDAGEAGVYLYPSHSKLFPTGLKFGVPHGYMLEVKNRSGNAAKRNLLVGAFIGLNAGFCVACHKFKCVIFENSNLCFSVSAKTSVVKCFSKNAKSKH